MLHPIDFTSIDEVPDFSIHFEELRIDNQALGPVEITVRYNKDLQVVFEISEALAKKDAPTPTLDSKISCRSGTQELELAITKISYSSSEGRTKVEAQPLKEPVIVETTQVSKKFSAILLSPPPMRNENIQLQDADGRNFSIEPDPRKSKNSCVVHSDLPLRTDDPLQPLRCFLNFLTFTKGMHNGFGNLFAYDNHNELAFNLVGFTRHDTTKRQTNWYDIEIQRDLPDIFLLFSKSFKDPICQKALLQAINFYRASNTSREFSLEMSIIASHTALEALVNYILAFHAGWSSGLLSNRGISFADKHRAAFTHFGKPENLLEKSPRLSDRFGRKVNFDTFDIISNMRNKLVHQDEKDLPSGMELHESWCLSQWLVEFLIFGILGYRGTIIDRRIYNGWRGTKCVLPFTNN